MGKSHLPPPPHPTAKACSEKGDLSRRRLADWLNQNATLKRLQISTSLNRHHHWVNWGLSNKDGEGHRSSKSSPEKITSRFSLPHSLQSNNRPSFTFKITQSVSKALGIKYYLQSSWRPHSSGEVEWTNQTLKNNISKALSGDFWQLG